MKRGLDVKILSKDATLYQYQSGSFDDDTQVFIASASKWSSGAVIVKLVDEGLLALNDLLKKFFTDVPKDKADITIV